MTTDDFRKLFDYHFTLNRRIWDVSVMALTPDQFVEKIGYSIGSVRAQCVHMLNVDESWFRDLQGLPDNGWYNHVYFGKNREKVRAKWDEVEAMMRGYLDTLTDEHLHQRYAEFAIWEVLFHVLNHGTDHRAQLLAALYNLGAPTFAQDYAFYAKGIDTSKPRRTMANSSMPPTTPRLSGII